MFNWIIYSSVRLKIDSKKDRSAKLKGNESLFEYFSLGWLAWACGGVQKLRLGDVISDIKRKWHLGMDKSQKHFILQIIPIIWRVGQLGDHKYPWKVTVLWSGMRPCRRTCVKSHKRSKTKWKNSDSEEPQTMQGYYSKLIWNQWK